MNEKELRDWLIHQKKELNKIKLPIVSVHYGLIKGSILMIDIVLSKLNHSSDMSDGVSD